MRDRDPDSDKSELTFLQNDRERLHLHVHTPRRQISFAERPMSFPQAAPSSPLIWRGRWHWYFAGKKRKHSEFETVVGELSNSPDASRNTKYRYNIAWLKYIFGRKQIIKVTQSSQQYRESYDEIHHEFRWCGVLSWPLTKHPVIKLSL